MYYGKFSFPRHKSHTGILEDPSAGSASWKEQVFPVPGDAQRLPEQLSWFRLCSFCAGGSLAQIESECTPARYSDCGRLWREYQPVGSVYECFMWCSSGNLCTWCNVKYILKISHRQGLLTLLCANNWVTQGEKLPVRVREAWICFSTHTPCLRCAPRQDVPFRLDRSEIFWFMCVSCVLLKDLCS